MPATAGEERSGQLLQKAELAYRDGSIFRLLHKSTDRGVAVLQLQRTEVSTQRGEPEPPVPVRTHLSKIRFRVMARAEYRLSTIRYPRTFGTPHCVPIGDPVKCGSVDPDLLIRIHRGVLIPSS